MKQSYMSCRYCTFGPQIVTPRADLETASNDAIVTEMHKRFYPKVARIAQAHFGTTRTKSKGKLAFGDADLILELRARGCDLECTAQVQFDNDDHIGNVMCCKEWND